MPEGWQRHLQTLFVAGCDSIVNGVVAFLLAAGAWSLLTLVVGSEPLVTFLASALVALLAFVIGAILVGRRREGTTEKPKAADSEKREVDEEKERSLKGDGLSYQGGHWQAKHAETLIKPDSGKVRHFAPVPAVSPKELRFFGAPRIEVRQISWGGSIAVTSQLCSCVLVDVESCQPAIETRGVMAKLIVEEGRNNISVPAAFWLDRYPRFPLKPFAHATLVVGIRPQGYKETLQLLRDNRESQTGAFGPEYVVIAGTEPGSYHRVRVEVFTQNGKQLSRVCEILTKDDGVKAQWAGDTGE